MREILVHGERFILHPKRALFWPNQNLLVAADLHLGKNETFFFGSEQNSPNDQWRELLELEEIATRFSAQHIMFLGDFLHSPHGLTEHIVQDFSDFLLRADQQVTLIPSNRDKAALRLLGAMFPKMEVLYQWQIEDFIFQHQPPERTPVRTREFFWCGHLNPMSDDLACFVVDEEVGVLPAYSPLKDGNEVSAAVGRRIFAADGESVIEIF